MLAKTALRLAAIEALCPSTLAASGPWPTIAGNRVYDTRLDPIDIDAELAGLEGKPIVTVYTERDHLKPYGEAKYPAQEFFCDLTIEMAIAALGVVTIPGPDGSSETIGTVEAALSDRQREGLLDWLDASVCQLLAAKRPGQDSPPSAALYNRIAMEVHESASEPQRADNRVVKLAMRTRTFKVKLKADHWPTGDDAPTGTLAFTANPANGFHVWFLSERFKFVTPTVYLTPAASRGEIAIGETLASTSANLLAFLQTSAPLFPILARASFAAAAGETVGVTATALPGRKPASLRMSSNVAGATWTPTPRTGFDLLPEPLRQVAKALDPASSGYALCQSLADLAPAQAARTPLQDVQLFVGMHGTVPTQSDGSDADIEASALD
jgi:hypothetical protein